MVDMVNRKAVAAGLLAALAGGGAVVFALKRREAPEEEGIPRGEISIQVTPLGKPQGHSFKQVQGQLEYGVGATIDVNGVCTAGYPAPDMTLELYDNDIDMANPPRATLTQADVSLNTTYTLTETMGAADIGEHSVHGRMVLTNPLGSWEFLGPLDTAGNLTPLEFGIGEVPPGEITVDVTLT